MSLGPIAPLARQRKGVAVAILIVSASFGGAPAIGAVPISQEGKLGTYVLVDTSGKPGVTCTYDAAGGGTQGNDIDLMEARGPRIFARDRSGRRDRQTVGVKYIFQRSVNEGGSGGWLAAKTTKLQKKTAFDDEPATFSKKSWLVPIEEDYHFRTLVILRWFRPGSTTKVQGSAKLRYVHYQVVWSGPQNVEQDRCLPEP